MLRSRERHCNVGSQPAASPISRILSGSIGSVVYVLTLTPLEVVKIRQQVATRPSAGGASAYSTTSKLQCCTPSTPLTFHPWRGALNNNCLMLPNTCSRRFESTAIHASTTHHDTFISSRRVGRPARGIFSTLLSISRTEGRAGLYAGLRPTLLAAVPNTAIYFTAYDEITDRLRRRHDESASDGNAKQKVYIPLVAGATARLISCVATAPLELIKTRQVSSAGSNRSGILEEFRILLRMNGPFALYRGIGPMICRDVPFSAIYFLSLETFKNILSSSSHLGTWGGRFYQERNVKTPTSVEVTQAFMGGGAAGAIATLATTPFDVIKTRRQMVQQQSVGAATNQGMFGYMRQMVREEGVLGLYKGNYVRMIKVAPGCAIMIACYEFGKRLFEDII